jgi:hypothetical protein
MVVFPRIDAEVGEYRKVKILRSISATLFGELIDVKETKNISYTSQDSGEVIFDLTPLVISSVSEHEHSGIDQPAVLLPII